MEKIINIDEKYMKMAIEIAKTAMGHTSPNPMVGCVVVKDNKVISMACHEKYGEYHAERNALLRCKEDTNGAALYVTLEPCCHYGKTPPCTEIIIEKGIKKVYIGSLDSNPLVAGKGVNILKENGIEVETGILESECLKLNEIFYHYIKTNMPFIAMKYAMTIDGKIAAYTGDSKWVTSEAARNHVQLLRKKYSGILVGINTVIADNPMLNCRIENGCDPVRIICDSKLNIPLDCNIINTADKIKTIIAYANNGTKEIGDKINKLTEKKIQLICCGNGEKVDLKLLFQELGRQKIDSVLIEGGGEINASALEQKLVNKIYAYIAPKIIMGRTGKSPVAGEGKKLMCEAIDLKEVSVENIEGDILVKGYIKK